ncbi:MAG: ABC transporter ATP-binding protein [Planctomycetes bacterium]|nr:ABC transporter ATP-binding protein [Planctomycetota bacterium]MBI3835378.1 ABC transporter ATP-binding protein [Planctomycetota bacterium]
MTEHHQPVVQTAGLCKVFRDFWRRPRVEAVKDLNLEIRPGEVFGLLGPNGSGKTTTIKMLLGLLYPTRGRISIFGKPPTDVAVKSRIGFLPEESYLYRFLIAQETLDFFGRLFRLPSRVRKDRANRLLDMVGLRHEAKRPVGEYSKGMARRIGLAQALINDPEFLILDEPTSGLDPIGARQIKDVIRSLGNKGKTILLSSHVLADVEDVCDRVTILYGGQQRAAGDIGELLSQSDMTQITAPRLTDHTLDEVRALVQRLEKRDILSVSHPRMKLEDFFLRIVEEARAANIKTYGARAGGEVPDFLSKAAQTPTDEVIDSLVYAGAPRSQPIVVPVPISARKNEAASQAVLNELLGTSPPPTSDADSATLRDGKESAKAAGNADAKTKASKSPDSSRRKIAADEGFIQSLVDRPEGNEKSQGSG